MRFHSPVRNDCCHKLLRMGFGWRDCSHRVVAGDSLRFRLSLHGWKYPCLGMWLRRQASRLHYEERFRPGIIVTAISVAKSEKCCSRCWENQEGISGWFSTIKNHIGATILSFASNSVSLIYDDGRFWCKCSEDWKPGVRTKNPHGDVRNYWHNVPVRWVPKHRTRNRQLTHWRVHACIWHCILMLMLGRAGKWWAWSQKEIGNHTLFFSG